LPLSVALTVSMNASETSSPVFASFRKPVSIGCPMSTRTSAILSVSLMRMRIGSGTVSFSDLLATTTNGDLDLARGHVKLAIRLNHDPQDRSSPILIRVETKGSAPPLNSKVPANG
jgi:hypothetical protein